jgi:hypothetical protein
MATQTTQSSLDELAKGLATGTLSRGKAIRWMGGALLGAALASLPGVAWANDCRRLGRECRRDSQCCSKNCVRRGDDKVCACPEGKSRCNDRCVNLKTNERHCGSCTNPCAEGTECVNGICLCPDSRPQCGTGTSATCCAAGQECVDGVCSGGEPICTPSCPPPSPTVLCTCTNSVVGAGPTCADFGVTLIVSSCADCPPDQPGAEEFTLCLEEREGEFTCARPCSPAT